MTTQQDVKAFLHNQAYLLRRDSLISTTAAGSGHPTSCLSAADIASVLFFHVMRFDPACMDDLSNDRFILSKGHAAPLLYAVMRRLGLIDKEKLNTLRTFGSLLEGHPVPLMPFIEAATGSLGQGLSIGAGMALFAKRFKYGFKTYVLMGDSEVAEGSVWEAAQLASYHQLDNLIGIVDFNRLGQSTVPMDAHRIEDHAAKWRAFGWHVYIVDGHSIEDLLNVFALIAKVQLEKPTMILAYTFKGYGVSFAENKEGFHGRAFTQNELKTILSDLKLRFSPDPSLDDDATWQPLKRDSEKPISHELIVLGNAPFEKNSAIATRKAFGIALCQMGRAGKNIMSFDAEVKNSTYAELFAAQFPERFVECFIAEQNMVGMAVGAAKRGARPFVSTFGAFFSRSFDQLRMAAIGRASFCCIGSHAGVSIGQDGPSQMALEDIAIFRSLPDSLIFYPSDGISTWRLVELMANYKDGISYLRTTRAETPIIYTNQDTFAIGGSQVFSITQNDTVCIISAGITVFEAFKAQQILLAERIFVTVIDAYSVKPLDNETIRSYASQMGRVITVEDHYLEGGLGEAVLQAIQGIQVDCQMLAVKNIPHSGQPEELLGAAEIDAHAIVRAVKTLLAK